METKILGPCGNFHAGISPHSLGKLIEWKLEELDDPDYVDPDGPHSLGKLIEWKPKH
jgi:hypothetical protein